MTPKADVTAPDACAARADHPGHAGIDRMHDRTDDRAIGTAGAARGHRPTGGGRFGGFVLVGLASTVLNLGSRYGFQWAMGYEAALLGATVVGVVSAYLMNRWWVFGTGSTPLLAGLLRFALVNLLGSAISWVAAVVLYRQVLPWLGLHAHADLVAHAIGIAVPVLPNYLLHRAWTFAR